MRDALGRCEFLPLGLGFRFGEGFLARKEVVLWRELGKGAFVGGGGWEGEEFGEEDLDAVAGEGLEVLFQVFAGLLVLAPYRDFETVIAHL